MDLGLKVKALDTVEQGVLAHGARGDRLPNPGLILFLPPLKEGTLSESGKAMAGGRKMASTFHTTTASCVCLDKVCHLSEPRPPSPTVEWDNYNY